MVLPEKILHQGGKQIEVAFEEADFGGDLSFVRIGACNGYFTGFQAKL